MDLTRERALELHREMWTDMQKELGDCPDADDREEYKCKWCLEHGFRYLHNRCFLCEYSHDKSPWFCHHCPVKWPTHGGTCTSHFLKDDTKLEGDYYHVAPISEILALPEREDV